MRNMLIAVAIAFETLAIIGAVVLLWPILEAIGGLMRALLVASIPILPIPIAIYVVYRILNQRDQ